MKRSVWLICLFLCIVVNSLAQQPGELKWKYKDTNVPYVHMPCIGLDGSIYITSEDSTFLISIDQDGKLKWKNYLGYQIQFTTPSIGMDGSIYIARSQGDLLAFNPDGSINWTYELNPGIMQFPAPPAIGSNNEIYIRGDNECLIALNSDGSFLWKENLHSTGSGPVIGTDGSLYLKTPAIQIRNPEGRLKYDSSPEITRSSLPIINSDGTYYLIFGGYLNAFYPDGSIRWRAALTGSNYLKPLIDSDGNILVFQNRLNMYSFSPSGDLNWKVDIDPDINITDWVLGDNNIVYGLTYSGAAAIDFSGNLLWDYDTSIDVISSKLNMDNNGVLYFCASDSNLYAIQTSSTGLAKSTWPKEYGDLHNRSNTYNPSSPVALTSLDTLFIQPFNTVILDASNSFDPEGDALTYKWSLVKKPTGGMAAFSDSNSVITEVTFTEQIYGTYVFGVVVTDSDNNVSGSNIVVKYEPLNWSVNLTENQTSPAMSLDGTLFVGCDDGTLYAINNDGSIKWSFTTNGKILSDPVIGIDETVLIGSDDGYLYAIDLLGNLKWKYSGEFEAMHSPTILPDSTIWIAFNDRYIHTLNPDGTLKCKFRINTTVSSAPVFDGDSTIYFGTNHLYALGINDTLKWEFDLRSTATSEPMLSLDGTVFIADSSNTLYAISENNLIWEFKANGIIVGSPITDEEGCVYFGSVDSVIYALKPDGLLKWKYKTDDRIVASPLLGDDGRIYIGSIDGFLYSLNTDEGILNWKYQTGHIESSPVMDDNGNLYLTNSNGKLYSIQTDANGLANSAWPKFRQNNLNSGNLYTKPYAEFETNLKTGYKPFTVSFTDLSKGYITDWLWDFGDGEMSTDRNPKHTFTDGGTYTVSLKVEGPFGSSSCVNNDLISVITASPNVDFSTDTTRGVIPFHVQFTSHSDDNIVEWLWDFGDSTTSSEQNPEHIYQSADTLTVSLTVKNNLGLTETIVKENYIIASEPKPTAYFVADTTFGQVPFTVHFSDNSTGTISQWSWFFGDDESSADQNPTHTYTQADTYTVKLQVGGAFGSDNIVRENYIIVTDAKPVAAFNADSTFGYIPFTVQFNDLSTGNVDNWLWNFGDGTTSSEQNPEHTFTTADSFTISLIVSGIGGADSLVKQNYIKVDINTVIQDDFPVPQNFQLYQNYPNPFNPVSCITFDLPETEFVELNIYNTTGQLVSTLMNELKQAGQYKVYWDASSFPTGMYYYKIKAGDHIAIKRMVLVK